MPTDSQGTKELARRLLAFESVHDESPYARVDVAVRVIDQLRLHLVRVAGVDGFRSLLARALTLARREVPLLDMVRVRADGSLEGLEGIEKRQEVETAAQAGVVLVAQLLELLVTFIGKPLTLRLVLDEWPGAFPEGADLRTEGKQ